MGINNNREVKQILQHWYFPCFSNVLTMTTHIPNASDNQAENPERRGSCGQMHKNWMEMVWLYVFTKAYNLIKTMEKHWNRFGFLGVR